MPLTRHSLALDIRPFLERNLILAGSLSHAVYGSTAKLHERASRREIVRKLQTSVAEGADVRERVALQGMLLARNLASVVTVPLDFAFGTGRWENREGSSVSPYHFAEETIAHPCSLGISGALLSATTALWSVFAAAVVAAGCAVWATGKLTVCAFRGPDNPASHLSWESHYKATEDRLLQTEPRVFGAATSLPLSLLGARPVSTVPMLGRFARTHLVRGLPWIAPLSLFAPVITTLFGRALTATLKFGVSGIGYTVGYAAGSAYARTR